jgi:iron complex outermembrane recepter protein
MGIGNFKYLVAISIICFPFNLLATEATKDYVKSDREIQASSSIFNFDIYSLSKKKENAFDVASATYVLTSEDIRRSGVTYIPEALRLIPGIQVSQIDGNKWAISIRGSDHQFSNKLLVMIDGRTVYTPLFSGVFWDIHDYVLEDVEKIEVVRGPGGSIWGANAVNGVINIITKSAVQTQGAYFSQVVGNSDRSITEARYGGKVGDKDYYRLYAKNSIRGGSYDAENNNDLKNDGNRQSRAGFRYDIGSIENSSLSIIGDVFEGKASRYFSTLQNAGSGDKDSSGGDIIVNFDKTFSKKSSISLNTYFDYDEFRIPVLTRSNKTLDVDFQHFYNFSRENNFTWGLGYRQIMDDIKEGQATAIVDSSTTFTPINYTPNQRNDEIFSAFIQDKIGIIADKLYLTVGSKFLHNDFTGFEYQPNARLAYYPARNQTLWASVSRAIRMPTRGEVSFDIKEEYYGSTVSLGSPQAKSEELVAYEMGYRIKPTTKTLIDVTAFYNDYSNLRTYESIDGSEGGTPIAANKGKGRSFGGEILGKWQVNNRLKLEASYDFLKTSLDTNGSSTDDISALASSDALKLSENRSPKNQFRLRSYFNVTPKIEFDNMLYYVDSLSSAKLLTTDPHGVSSYVRFDTRIGYLPNRNLDLSFGIRNLFDDRHQEYYSALYNTNAEIGRTYFVKAVWQY